MARECGEHPLDGTRIHLISGDTLNLMFYVAIRRLTGAEPNILALRSTTGKAFRSCNETADGRQSAMRGRIPMATTSPAGGNLDRQLHMVNSQLRTGDVVDQEVLAAFLETPREPFVAAASAPIAFLDRETPALGARTRRLLRPLTLARMLQAASVKAGDRALDVGGGSGYGAALLDFMGAKVAALESDPGAVAAARELLRGRQGVTVREGPLEAGAADLAPFDVIVVEGAFRVYPDVADQPARRRRPAGRDRRDHGRASGGAVRAERRGREPARLVRDDGGHPRRISAGAEFRVLAFASRARAGRRTIAGEVSHLCDASAKNERSRSRGEAWVALRLLVTMMPVDVSSSVRLESTLALGVCVGTCDAWAGRGEASLRFGR